MTVQSNNFLPAEGFRGGRHVPARPGGALARRPLHFFLLLDGSISMEFNGKIDALNYAVKEMTPAVRHVAEQNPHVDVLMRALVFAGDVYWHTEAPTPASCFNWTPIAARGDTPMGKALSAVSTALDMSLTGRQACPPAIVLVSDGQPTDDFDGGLRNLMNNPWGGKAVRLAIAIGRDADMDKLQTFIGNPDIAPLRANNTQELISHIRLVSTTAVQLASSFAGPRSQALPIQFAPSSSPIAAVSSNIVW